ncbi:MAG TPA: AAA family ATPase [Bacteroidales bacterium]|nr:AAA family ATPase [Bacteroidales bacterium]
MIVIGITGTLGAGKGAIVHYLVNKAGFVHCSVRNYLVDEIQKRNLPVNRDSMVIVANELRYSNSPSFIVDQLYRTALNMKQDCVIESIRTPGEVESLRQKGSFFLFAVDADPNIRFQRIKARNSETDQIDFETFLENEAREMDATDFNKQNLRKCIGMADFVFQNNNSLDKLYDQVENVLQQIRST